MKWDYWICLFTETHCTARGLRTTTIAAYKATLHQFRDYVRIRANNRGPDQVTATVVLEYLEHLRRERENNESALNRQVTVLRGFYKASVAMGHLEPEQNPMAHFPKMKSVPRKLPVTLSADETRKLLCTPPDDTVIGLRDRAILALLYGTGIRASECAELKDRDVDLNGSTIAVTGKGGHERTLPLNTEVVKVLSIYRCIRGAASANACFFRSRYGKGMSRNAIYQRVRTHARLARIQKSISPHKLRHTFATHLMRKGVGIVTIRDLLGHRQIASTQVYLHVTAKDLREAAERHPIGELACAVAELLPDVRLPFQSRRQTSRYG
jgi:site-specific recombinase XerD